ncbi:hypothetical protein, partial [Xanthomonas vasicola]
MRSLTCLPHATLSAIADGGTVVGGTQLHCWHSLHTRFVKKTKRVLWQSSTRQILIDQVFVRFLAAA